ncbi:hypothetical protein HID58_014643 [Brassica napus]|uniref:Uncharacterized protein n=1 Tax=Brassica napus TaxID=3708 RepID=A0ABQ8DHW5_BRANA|nr:hypothetical protein HID58_014643 [Brassica napus]
MIKHDLELRYLLPKRSLRKQNLNTPPVKVGNDRQYHSLLCLCKVENIRLCVEVKVKENHPEGASENPKEPVQIDATDDDDIQEILSFSIILL